MVLHPTDQHLVAGAQHVTAEARRNQIDRLRCAAREDYLFDRSGVDEALNLAARLLEQGSGTLAQLVHAAVHVRVIVRLLFRDGVYHESAGTAQNAALSRYVSGLP